MEIPKIRRIRRHASLSRRSLSISRSTQNISSCGILLSKSNPYVGWFRHAPSSTGASMLNDSLKKTRRMKKFPYTELFRHSPPSRFVIKNSKMMAEFENHLNTLLVLEERRMKLVKVDGYLRGGAPTAVPWLDRESLKRTLKDSPAGSESATIQVLSRLATWFLFPVAHDQSSCGYCPHRESKEKQVIDMFPNFIAAEESSSVDTSDDCSTITNDEDASSDESCCSSHTIGTHLRLSRVCQSGDLSQTVSSLAEAYYAYQSPDDVDNSLHVMENDNERFDYVITQIDIARMARNASRHLDVESIYALPTKTYQSEGKAAPDFGLETGSSWMIVAPADEEESNNDDNQVCVICLEHFQDGDRLRMLPCSHCFHVGCIDRWLSGSHSFDECFTNGCPTCKKRPEVECPFPTDGSVPSWAFAKLGDALAKGISQNSSFSLSS